MIHILELSWAEGSRLKEKYPLKGAGNGLFSYSVALLPAELRPYSSRDYSYARWVEDERNAAVMPPQKSSSNPKFSLEQELLSKALASSHDDGNSGFLAASPMASGKGLAVIEGLIRSAIKEGFGEQKRAKLLIAAAPSSLGTWRRLLRGSPEVNKTFRVLLMEHRQLNKLLTAPPQARVTANKNTKIKQKAAQGVSTIPWDFIIFDDSHLISDYPRHITSQEAVAVSGLNLPYKKGSSPYSVFITSSPGESPLDFSLYSKVLTERITGEHIVTPKKWASFLKESGYFITQHRGQPRWGPFKEEEDEKRRKRDLRALNSLMRRSPSVYTEKISSFIPQYCPLELRIAEEFSYRKMWNEIKEEAARRGRKKDDLLLSYERRRGGVVNERVCGLLWDLNHRNRLIVVRVSEQAAAERLQERLTEKGLFSSVYTENDFLKRNPLPLARIIVTTVSISLLAPKDSIVVFPDAYSSGLHRELLEWEKHKPTAKIFSCYIANTFEEEFVESLNSKSPANLNNAYKRLFTKATVRTTPPNKLS